MIAESSKFFNSYLYKKTSIKKGFDITIANEIFIGNLYAGLINLSFATKFILNSNHSVGFIVSGGHFLHWEDNENLKNFSSTLYSNIGFQYRLSSVNSLVSFIIGVGIKNGVYILKKMK